MQSSSTTGNAHNIRSKKQSGLLSWHRLIFASTIVDGVGYDYTGSGTLDDPYLVEWLPDDTINPMNYGTTRKWVLTALTALSCLVVSFSSSAYTGGIPSMIEEFGISQTVALLGVSCFVLGFAIGPVLWAPLSEIYGRQIIFLISYGGLLIFNIGGACSQTPTQLIVLRTFAGIFGSSPLTNAGGVIADIFTVNQRGLAMSFFACAPFMGPIFGPIAGGFLGEAAGWKWIEGLIAIVTALLFISCVLFIPETYAPVLLQKRASELSARSGKVYVSRVEHEKGKLTVLQVLKTSLLRPWILLFREAIVLILSIYLAIMYGTVYMFFAAFPIVFHQIRGWSTGVSGLAFIGIAIGMITALVALFWENKRYTKVATRSSDGRATPEDRLPVAMLASVITPIGLFWFAWTNGPEVHWIVCILSTSLFGFGNVMITLSCMNYLIDAYVIYAASVMAGSAFLRSCFGAAFPLFTAKMYEDLGLHWASSIPAFLSLACVPFPFLFYKYGAFIRKHCRYAAEAQMVLDKILRTKETTEARETKALTETVTDKEVV